MMNIVVTGAGGRLGQVVVGELLVAGHAVLAVDQHRPEKMLCRFVRANLLEPASVYDLLQGADVVIHLAAVPGPNVEAPAQTFHTNVTSTYNVVEAAAALRLKRVVLASSLFTLGWPHDPLGYWPQYAPADEEHPLSPFEAYALSKQVSEEICGAAARRSGLSCVSLRISNIVGADQYFAFPWPDPTLERPVRFVMWPYVDRRDAATACRLAATAQLPGLKHEAVLIAAPRTRFAGSTAELLERFSPQTALRSALPGNSTVISLAKARHLLGYEAQFGWPGSEPPA